MRPRPSEPSPSPPPPIHSTAAPLAAPPEGRPEPPDELRAGRWWLWGLLSLVLLSGGALWWGRAAQAPPTPGPDDGGPALIALELVTVPPGARAVVQLGRGPRVAVQSTPVWLEFERGQDLTITFRAPGYMPAVVKHRVRTSGRVEADLSPVGAGPAGG